MTMKLREITLPLSINIVGANNGLPHVINIVANSIGPRVEVLNNIKEIDFGTMDVLTEYSMLGFGLGLSIDLQIYPHLLTPSHFLPPPPPSTTPIPAHCTLRKYGSRTIQR